MEIQTLADSLSEETYQDGEVVCTEGQEGNFFYIIKEGIAQCYKGTEMVAELKDPGTYFGEIALITSKPRQATVKASGSLKVLPDRATFTRVLGAMEEVLKRDMAKYSSYVSSEI